MLLGALVLTNTLLEAEHEKSTLLVLRDAVNFDSSIFDVVQPRFVTMRDQRLPASGVCHVLALLLLPENYP